MTLLQDALAWDETAAAPKPGQVGTFSEWITFVDGRVRGAALQICERSYVGPADVGVSIPLAPNSALVVEVRVAAFGRERRVASLRVRPPNAPVSRGAVLGTLDVDIGGVAVCDRDPMAVWYAQDPDAWDDWSGLVLNDYMEYGDDVGLIPCEALGVAIPYADGGFGDGSYLVYALHTPGQQEPVGLECEFLTPEAVYPFADKVE